MKKFKEIKTNFHKALDQLATRHVTGQSLDLIKLSKWWKVTGEKFNKEHDFTKDPVEKLDINNLIVSQPDVTEAGVAMSGENNAPINVLLRDNKYYVVDGHHRLVYRMLKGKKHIKANIWTND